MKKKKAKKILVNTLYVGTIIVLLGILTAMLVFVYFARDLPRPERYADRPLAEPTRIYDRTGQHILYTIYGEEKREVVDLAEIPDHFINALLLAEDTSFYEHFGIDFRGIARSMITNIRTGRAVAGGSTISQQFVRTAFLGRERTIVRKVREIVLTLELERRYSKDEILEFYINEIPFGHNAYGVELAAQTYFNKSASDLSLAESTALVSLIPAPSFLSPFGENIERLMARRNLLLNRMVSAGHITSQEAEEAKEEEMYFHRSAQYLHAPHFVMHVKGLLENKYGEDFLKSRGLSVYTTIDFDMQKRAEEIVKQGVKNNYYRNAHNAALVAIDPNTGEVLTMVGSADYFQSSRPEGCAPGISCYFDPYTNVALSARQPGSAFKPFVYATAFQNGYTDQTIVVDERTNFGTLSNPYVPRNYDGLFRGPVTLRESLAQSLNVPSVKVLKDLAGLEKSVENAKRFGINLSRPAEFYGLPLVLGGGDVKLLEITSAYGVFATEGYRVPPLLITKITDKDGNIVEKNESTPRLVLQPSVARLVTDVLSDNEARSPVFGNNSLLHFPDSEIASKTGSTQNFRDGWTIGYNSSIVAGVWVGNNDNTSMVNAPGVSVAAPIWRAFIESVI